MTGRRSFLIWCAIAAPGVSSFAGESVVQPGAEAISNWRSKLDDDVHSVQRALVSEKVCLSNVAMVSRRGTIVYRRAVESGHPGDWPISDDTLFPIWSMTKPITCVAAMILCERGKFELDDPVSEVIPQLAKLRVKTKEGMTVPLKRQITYRDLFRHTSGIYGYDGSFHEEGTWKEVMELDSLAELIDLVEKEPIGHQPGERYTYGLSTAVLGRAVEVLSGKPLADFFDQEIFDPLGMKHTRFHLTAEDRKRFQPLFVKEGEGFRSGTAAEDELYYAPGSALSLGGEGLVSTMEDYGRFCQMLVDRGEAPGGKQIISGATLDLMLTDQLQGIRSEDGNLMGLGFYILRESNEENVPAGIFGWGGYHTTHFWIDPKNELYGLFMTRLYPSPGATLTRFRKAVYGALSLMK